MTSTQIQTSTDFMDYINPDICQKLEELYGEKTSELIDYEMRKIVRKKNDYVQRYGMTLDELTDITHGGFFNYDPSGLGYLYGYPLSRTWEWANATMDDDWKTLERLTKHEAIEEAKYKAKFIEYYAENLLSLHQTNDRHLKAANRNHLTRDFNNVKQFMDERDTWFLK
jgi:ribosomal protein L17